MFAYLTLNLNLSYSVSFRQVNCMHIPMPMSPDDRRLFYTTVNESIINVIRRHAQISFGVNEELTWILVFLSKP